MYAVIRAGGKQYRVAPGDVIKVEKLAPAEDGTVEFSDIVAVSSENGKIGSATGETRVVGEVVEEGRNSKILVFHYKRKKQYKKLQGHRQAFTQVRIARITVDGHDFNAPEQAAKPRHASRPKAAESEVSEKKAAPKKAAKKASGKAKASGKTPAKKAAGKKAGTASKAKKK